MPLGKGKSAEADGLVAESCSRITALLNEAGVRCHVDDRDYLKPGPKFFHWERRGVPLRIEVGPREAEALQCVVCPRIPPSDKSVLSIEGIGEQVKARLAVIHETMLAGAKERLDAGIQPVGDYASMVDALGSGKAGMFLAPWTEDAAEEELVKAECKATIRCYPLDANAAGAVEGKKCFKTGRPATHMALFARAF